MSKHKNLAVTKSADMAGRALAALTAQGDAIAEKLNGRSLQLVKSGDKFKARIECGPTLIQIEGEGDRHSYAVSTHD